MCERRQRREREREIVYESLCVRFEKEGEEEGEEEDEVSDLAVCH